jgi:hypothetical protein
MVEIGASSILLKPPLSPSAASPGETLRLAPPMRSKTKAHVSHAPPIKYAFSLSSVRYRLHPA